MPETPALYRSADRRQGHIRDVCRLTTSLKLTVTILTMIIESGNTSPRFSAELGAACRQSNGLRVGGLFSASRSSRPRRDSRALKSQNVMIDAADGAYPDFGRRRSPENQARQWPVRGLYARAMAGKKSTFKSESTPRLIITKCEGKRIFDVSLLNRALKRTGSGRRAAWYRSEAERVVLLCSRRSPADLQRLRFERCLSLESRCDAAWRPETTPSPAVVAAAGKIALFVSLQPGPCSAGHRGFAVVGAFCPTRHPTSLAAQDH